MSDAAITEERSPTGGPGRLAAAALLATCCYAVTTMYSALSFVSTMGCLVGPLVVGGFGAAWGLRPAIGASAAGPVVLVGLLLILLPAKR